MAVADTSKPAALLIGANRYRNQRTLKGAEGDACDVRAWLLASGVPRGNITTLLSSDSDTQPAPKPFVPIAQQVHAWLDDLDEQAGDCANGPFPLGPRVYVMFAGHGYNAALAQQTAIFPGTSKKNWDVLPIVPIRNYLQTSAYFNEIVVISDACRDVIDYAPEPGWTRRAEACPYTSDVRVFEAYASQTGGKAKEREFKPGHFRGVMTQAFLRGVRGAARDAGGNVTSEKLKNFVKSAVIKELGEKFKPEVLDPTPIVLGQAPELTSRLTVTPKNETTGSATIRRHEDNATQQIPLDQGVRVFDIPLGRYTITTPAGRTIELEAVWEDEHVSL